MPLSDLPAPPVWNPGGPNVYDQFDPAIVGRKSCPCFSPSSSPSPPGYLLLFGLALGQLPELLLLWRRPPDMTPLLLPARSRFLVPVRVCERASASRDAVVLTRAASSSWYGGCLGSISRVRRERPLQNCRPKSREKRSGPIWAAFCCWSPGGADEEGWSC